MNGLLSTATMPSSVSAATESTFRPSGVSVAIRYASSEIVMPA